MAEPPGAADDLVKRLVEANVTYVRAWGELVTDWLGAVGEVVRDVPRSVTLTTPPAPTGRTPTSAEASATSARAAAAHARHAGAGGAQPDAAQGPAAAPAAALVLEAPAGGEASGAFEVENVLGAPASASVVLDPFTDAAGASLAVATTIRPEAVTLEAGESTVVVVRVTVPDDARPGTDYRSVVRIEGIPAGTVGVVLRRTGE